MNREQRRNQAKLDRAQKRAMWPGGFVDVPLETGINGVFTVAGVRRMKNGNITRSCKPGTETEWTARLV